MFSLVLKSTPNLCAVCKSVCEVLPLLAVPLNLKQLTEFTCLLFSYYYFSLEYLADKLCGNCNKQNTSAHTDLSYFLL